MHAILIEFIYKIIIENILTTLNSDRFNIKFLFLDYTSLFTYYYLYNEISLNESHSYY